MLAERWSVDEIEALLAKNAPYRPFPPAADRAAWNALARRPLARRRADWLIGMATAAAKEPVPVLSASAFSRFIRDGDRSEYELPYFHRRRLLGIFGAAEAFEYRGEYLWPLIDVLAAILAEAHWTVPAHTKSQVVLPGGGEDPLPAPDATVVDLFAAETAYAVAETLLSLEAEINETTGAVVAPLRREIERRVLTPALTHEDHWWWEGYNNWSPWCASSVLGAALAVWNTKADRPRLARLTWRLMGVIDRFYDRYPPDGGCDEGPMYWGVAAGAMSMFLEDLRAATGGAVDVYDDPKLRAMGRYIFSAHLGGPWFMNFADAHASGGVRVGILHRFGERLGDRDMVNLARLAARDFDPAGPMRMNGMSHTGFMPTLWRTLFWFDALDDDAPAEAPRHEAAVWLPDTQVLTAHAGEALTLAAKGGHNAENHNHNDVGQFILLSRDRPWIVDAGRDSYTRRTFGPQRYQLWFTRGAYHNAPVVNGEEQRAGREFAAHLIDYAHDESPAGQTRLSLDLTQAYPKEAGLAELTRTFTFLRGDAPALELRDAYRMDAGRDMAEAEWIISLLSPGSAREVSPGELRYEGVAAGGVAVLGSLFFDPALWTWREETVDFISDAMRAMDWPSGLNRVILRLRAPGGEGDYTLRFAAPKP